MLLNKVNGSWKIASRQDRVFLLAIRLWSRPWLLKVSGKLPVPSLFLGRLTQCTFWTPLHPKWDTTPTDIASILQKDVPQISSWASSSNTRRQLKLEASSLARLSVPSSTTTTSLSPRDSLLSGLEHPQVYQKPQRAAWMSKHHRCFYLGSRIIFILFLNNYKLVQF